MKVRLLPLTEFHKLITLSILAVLSGFTLLKLNTAPFTEACVVAMMVLLLVGRLPWSGCG